MSPNERPRPYPGRLIFDHLPKTAGQSVNRWLAGALGDCVTRNLNAAHVEMIRRYGGAHSVISGHVTFNGEGLDPRYQYATVLREPVDRALSWIYYLVSNVPWVPTTQPLIAGARRFLETEGAHATPEFIASVSNPYVVHFRSAWIPGVALGDAATDMALEVLRNYSVVGLYEDMPAFVSDLAGFIGIPVPKVLERINATASRPMSGAISERLRERIRGLTALDLALHERVATMLRSGDDPWRHEPPPAVSRWAPGTPLPQRAVKRPEVSIDAVALPLGGHVYRGSLLQFELDVTVHGVAGHLVWGFRVMDEDQRLVFGTNSQMLVNTASLDEPGRYRICFSMTAEFPIGTYAVTFSIVQHRDGEIEDVALEPARCAFEVMNDGRAPGVGSSPAPAAVTVKRMEEVVAA